MKPKICYALAFLWACNIAQAQEEVFIYNGNNKMLFEVNRSVKYVKFYGKHNRNTENLFNIFQTTDQVMPDVIKITLNDSEKALFDRKISETDSIFVTDELIYKDDGTKQCCFNHILLQTIGSVNLKEILESKNIPYISFERFGLYENEYLIRLSVSEALYYSNKLFETGYFVYVQPSFYRFNVFHNPMYSQQWGLKNTGQHGGMVGMDINVEPAWELSNGQGIRVAVVDVGVQLDHPDLQANLSIGYDATGQGSNGGYSSNDIHGTNCAGVIAACNNNIGVKGIAYKSKIVSIRSGYNGHTYDSYSILAFDYIKNNSIDVVSCSWGGGSENNMLTNAINYVVENGRNGLGIPVFFSAGNYNEDHPSTSVVYPASLLSTIAVGAINYCGECIYKGTWNHHNCDGQHNWGSCYGPGLDVVAPGVNIPTTTIGSDYTSDFCETSSACPHAAGVMALMLSANPCLTQTEARRILSLSCDKLDIYSFCYNNSNLSWNNEVGYGKINAYNAVLYSLAANQYHVQVNGNLVDTNDDIQMIIDNGICSSLGAGWYYCKQYEYSASISYPNMNNPQIIVMANGLSAATYNDGSYYACVASSTDTSAVLKTWKYYVYSNTAGQANNVFIPANDNIVFYATVFDVPQNNLDLSNQNISSGILSRSALRKLNTNNINVSGSAEVHLFAGDSVVFQNGTIISPTTGYFCAQSGVFNVCEHNASRKATINAQHNNYEEYIVAITDRQLFIYPNPNNGSFYVSLSNTEEEISGIRVMDIMGKTVYSNNHFEGSEVVLPNAKHGFYYVIVTLKNKTITEKIIVQ